MVSPGRLALISLMLNEEGCVDDGVAKELLDEVIRLRTVLEILARLGNGDHYGNSKGNCIAKQALYEYSGEKK